MTDVALAADSGPGCGLGHRRRMDALEVALRRRGATTTRVEVDRLIDLQARAVVVDSYQVRADDPRPPATVVAALDDLDRDLAVDLLIDPNPPGPPGAHTRAGRVLAGLRYALITEIPDHLSMRPIVDQVEQVLVTAGAADDAGIGSAIASEIARRWPDTVVQLVVGPWGQGAPPPVVPIQTTDGLLAHLAAADLVVTAGGVTMLESLRLGRPTVAVATAANQERAVRGVAAARAALTVPTGSGPAAVADAVVSLGPDLTRRRALAAAGPTLVDGRGPDRIAEVLLGYL